MARRLLYVLGAVLVHGACTSSLRAKVAEGADVKLDVEVTLAETADARREGLRGFDSLSPEEGLALVFPGASEVCITNAGVRFGIEAVFSEAGVVSAVEEFEAEEGASRCHRADEVLEVAAGVAARVEVGDDYWRE